MANKTRQTNVVNIITFVLVLLIVIVVCFLIKNIYVYLQNQYQLMEYPLEYSEYVEHFAKENDIDKYLVYAVIRTESGFNPASRSNVGARGLMQIMEDTYDWLNMKLGDDTTYDDMYTAKTNIRYGTYLLGYLMRYYGDETCAIAAYHAGIGSVDSWLENPDYSSDGKVLDRIPPSKDDTAHYVNKINLAYETYLKLYLEDNKNGN